MATLLERAVILLTVIAGLTALAGTVGYASRTLSHWSNITAVARAEAPLIERTRVLDEKWYENASELRSISAGDRDVVAIMVAADCPSCLAAVTSWEGLLSSMKDEERPHAVIVPLGKVEFPRPVHLEVALLHDADAFREAIGVTGIPLTWAIHPSKAVKFIQSGAPDEASLERGLLLLRKNARASKTEVLKIGPGQLVTRPPTPLNPVTEGAK